MSRSWSGMKNVGWCQNSKVELVNQHNYGKSHFFMGKLTISMAIFNSYVKLPEGTCAHCDVAWTWPRSGHCGMTTDRKSPLSCEATQCWHEGDPVIRLSLLVVVETEARGLSWDVEGRFESPHPFLEEVRGDIHWASHGRGFFYAATSSPKMTVWWSHK